MNLIYPPACFMLQIFITEIRLYSFSIFLLGYCIAEVGPPYYRVSVVRFSLDMQEKTEALSIFQPEQCCSFCKFCSVAFSFY